MAKPTTSPSARTIVKQVDHAIQYSDGTILLQDVRASYPHVFHLFKQTDKKTGKVSESYGIIGLMDKTTHGAAYKLLRAYIKQMLVENNKGENIAADRKFLKDGDPKVDEDGEAEPGKPENAGMWVVSTREQKGKRPKTLHRIKDPETGKAKRLDPNNEDDVAVIYGGCYVDMLIRPWWQNNADYGKRINAGIVAVQFRRKGEPFGKGNISDDDLDDTFEADDTDEDDDGDDL